MDLWALVSVTDGSRKYKDIRTLLSSLDQVLWPDSGWKSVSAGDLLMSDAAVKKTYRLAITLCHPDKHKADSPEREARADRIFNALNESFKQSRP